MDKVRKGLYIGNLETAQDFLQGTKCGMTHILSMLQLNMDPEELRQMRDSVTTRYPNRNGSSNVKRLLLQETKMVPLFDTDWENLLERLEECLEFVENGLKQGGEVLVHCSLGVSRSASVVIAYLMRSERLATGAAIAELKRFRPIASPKRGFVEQLQLFERMGYRVDKRSKLYKDFCRSRIKPLADAHRAGYRILPTHLAVPDLDDEGAAMIRCKMCNKLIATSGNEMKHGPGHCCRSIFLEPMNWMSTALELEVEQGKLSCEGCGARLGRFHWEGQLCYCGVKVQPAFQVFGRRVITQTNESPRP